MIPKVRIDAVTYDVEIKKGPIIVDRHDCKGMIDYNENRIELLDTVGASQQKVTLAHEIVHGIVYERGLVNMIKSDDFETLTDEIAKAFINLVRDNPDLIEYINN